jgi:uncharacterized protein
VHLGDLRAGGLRVWQAERATERIRGLLGRLPLAADEAMLLRPCRLVHTFGMAYAIDIVFIDRRGVVRRIDEAVPHSRVKGCFAAWQTLELAAGGARRHRLREREALPVFRKGALP